MTVDAFAADDETTWPGDVRALLDDRLEDLRRYHERRREVDSDPMNRYLSNPPPNAWEETHDETIERIDAAIRDHHLVGWHCTRLTADEIERIRGNGMRVAGADLAAERVRARVAAGDIPDALGKVLLEKSCAEHTNAPGEWGYRKGMVWFVFTRGPLREESGVSRLFGTWGGEILYGSHMSDPAVDGALRALGTACIIEAAVPVREIEAYGSIGKRLLCWYLHRRDVRTEDGDHWEGHTKVVIPASCVRRVVRRSDPDFVKLTDCDEWDEPIT